MRRNRRKRAMVFIVGLGVFLLLIYIVSSLFMGEERKAKDAVIDFYDYESAANYGKSWELLHTEIQAKFPRGAYVQDRAHVFNGHFGADTFSYEVGDSAELSNWRIEKEGESFGTVYEFEVRLNYHGKYGHFLFVQYVYVVREDGEWRLLWDYKK